MACHRLERSALKSVADSLDDSLARLPPNCLFEHSSAALLSASPSSSLWSVALPVSSDDLA